MSSRRNSPNATVSQITARWPAKRRTPGRSMDNSSRRSRSAARIDAPNQNEIGVYHNEKSVACKRRRSRASRLARALLLPPSMDRERFEIDSVQSAIVFSARKSTPAPVRGRFSRWSASVELDGGELERGCVDVMIDTTSVETGDAAVDRLLTSAPFLDVARHPEAAFKSTC